MQASTASVENARSYRAPSPVHDNPEHKITINKINYYFKGFLKHTTCRISKINNASLIRHLGIDNFMWYWQILQESNPNTELI